MIFVQTCRKASVSFLSSAFCPVEDTLIRAGRIRLTDVGLQSDLTYPKWARCRSSGIVKHRQPALKPQQSSLTNRVQTWAETREKDEVMFVISADASSWLRVIRAQDCRLPWRCITAWKGVKQLRCDKRNSNLFYKVFVIFSKFKFFQTQYIRVFSAVFIWIYIFYV